MKNKGLYVIGIVIVFFAGVIGTLYTVKELNLINTNGSVSKTITEYTVKEEGSIKDAIDKVYDSVVYVETKKSGVAYGSGSGFFYKIDGDYAYILTNEHVITGASEVYISTNDEDNIEATLLGSDEYTDTAVLRVPKEYAIKVATLATTENVEVGDTIFTVGTPVGKTYMGTVTKGIISGKNRTVTTSTSYAMEVYQFDAAINSGNSGGPLVNLAGEVIGINSMKLVQTSIEGMGFAIPIVSISNLLERLEKNESIDRPVIGVSMIDVTNPYQLLKYNITLDSSIKEGVVIVSVSEDTPSFEAGIKSGDVIIKMDNVNVQNSSYFKSLLYKHKIGDKVTLSIIRDNKTINVDVTLNMKLDTE